MERLEVIPTIDKDPEPQEVNQLLRLALEKNVPVETLERLTTLYERMADRKAAQEFNAAMAQFQRECPAIEKLTESTQFSQVTREGTKKAVRYAELDQIANSIRPHLHKHGLSYTWDSWLNDGGKTLTCVCILRHENGHEARASFTGPAGSNAGASEIQKCAAALTYAKRQSLTQVLGLTCCDPDTDGAPPPGELQTISVDQANYLHALMEEVGQDSARFLKWAKVERVEDVPASLYTKAVTNLERKRSDPH